MFNATRDNGSVISREEHELTYSRNLIRVRTASSAKKHTAQKISLLGFQFVVETKNGPKVSSLARAAVLLSFFRINDLNKKYMIMTQSAVVVYCCVNRITDVGGKKLHTSFVLFTIELITENIPSVIHLIYGIGQ